MSRRYDFLDRLGASFPAPDRSFESFLRHRDRKRRRERLISIVVALLLAALVIGTSLRAIERGEELRPATPNITRSNVARLTATWRASVPRAATIPAVGDGLVFVGSPDTSGLIGQTSATGQRRLYAFDAACGAVTECRPTWTAETGRTSQPVVSNGVVYVANAEEDHNRIFAFSTRCGSAGATCLPLWTANIGPAGVGGVNRHPVVGGANLHPVVDGDTLFVPASDRLYAFPLSCSAGCRPLWTAPMPSLAQSFAVGNGTVFVGTVDLKHNLRTGWVLAYRSACRTDGRVSSAVATSR